MNQRMTMSFAATAMLATLGLGYPVAKSSLTSTSTSGYGLYLVKTLPAACGAPGTRSSDGTAIASGNGTSLWYAGGISSSFFTGTPSAKYNNLFGYRMVESGTGSTSSLSVDEKNLVSTGDTLQAVRALGLGSVSDLGQFVFRFDNGSSVPVGLGLADWGGGPPNPPGVDPCRINANWDFSGPFGGGTGSGYSCLYNGMGGGGSVQYQIPSIGDTDSIVFVSNFARQIRYSVPPYTPGAVTTFFDPLITLRTLMPPEDQRGSVVYNQVAGKYVIPRIAGTPNTTVTKIEVGCLNVPPTPPTMNVISLPAGWAGTNYFGRTSFAGPAQIAMNDNGDIAMVVYQTGTTPQLRFKRLIFNKCLGGCTYAGWTTIDTFDTLNNATGTNGGSLAVSSPALDNAGNIWISVPTSNPADSSVGPNSIINTIYRYPGKVNVLTEGDTITTGGITETVELIPTQVATEDRYNANVINNNTTGIGPASIQRAVGGVWIALQTRAPGAPTADWKWALIDKN